MVIEGDLDNVPALSNRHARAVAAELVHNAITHSSATWLELYVGVGLGEIEVRVTDDGIGTDATGEDPRETDLEHALTADLTVGLGVGLENVEARARELDGTFSFVPDAGRGSVACWRVPLPAGAGRATMPPTEHTSTTQMTP